MIVKEEKYLNELKHMYIREQNSVTQLPSDLSSFLLDELYPYVWKRRGKFKTKDIVKNHKEQMKLYTSMASGKYFNTAWHRKHQSEERIRDDIQSAKNHLDYIKKNKLFCIHAYGNGDYAWYSFKDGKVYDDNHEIGMFNSQATGRDKANSWPPLPYKKWMISVMKQDHESAWRK